jgi:hypothetical protein
LGTGKKEYEKSKKLGIEIQRMWDVKCFVIQVNVGTTRSVVEGLRTFLESVPGNHSVDSIRKKKGP